MKDTENVERMFGSLNPYHSAIMGNWYNPPYNMYDSGYKLKFGTGFGGSGHSYSFGDDFGYPYLPHSPSYGGHNFVAAPVTYGGHGGGSSGGESGGQKHQEGQHYHARYKGKSQSSALSALTLLAFLFFLNILQTCLKEHMNAINPTVMVMTAGVGRQQQTTTKVFDNFHFDDSVFNVSSVVTNFKHSKDKNHFYEDFDDEFYINKDNSTINVNDFDYSS